MPRTLTFIQSAELYDAIYSFKNYARESDRLRAVINELVPGARTLLDVACGTGEHGKFSSSITRSMASTSTRNTYAQLD